MEYRITDKIVIVYPDVPMDIQGAPYVEREITRLIEDFRDHHFILNLENVHMINSAGVGVFIAILSRLGKKNCLLKISNLNFIVRKVMDFLSMNDIIDIYESEEDAINSFAVKV